ncbi:MAG: hypothetical protein JW812_03230 [Alphaproteobacteria bacterium]|nr:hypothetical protein [Alphaproteobacteria bacterium]MBN2779821.1 hypothetical protein [Alphaproteobacteria bacterium]
MKKTSLILLAGMVFPIMGHAACDADAFNNCMDNTCFKSETDICLCHSDFQKSATRMDNLSEASQEIEKVLSNELERVTDGQIETDIQSRIKRIERLLSNNTDDMAMPSFDDDILGEEMIPAGQYGTNYGKTALTSGWESCKSYIDTCEGDKQLPLKNYLQKADQACSRLEQHLEIEASGLRDALDKAQGLFKKTKSRTARSLETNAANCESELEGCMREACKGIYYLECYREAACTEDNRFACKKSLESVFESKKNKCQAELNKCGPKKGIAWDEFIEDRINDIPDYFEKQ